VASRSHVVLAFAMLFVIWGTTYLAIGQSVTDIPPIFMVAVRGLVAGGILYAWMRSRGEHALGAHEIVAMVPTAALLFGGGYVLVGWAEQSVPSGVAALLNSTTPAWVVLFEWRARRRERPTLRFAFSLAIGFLGVWLLVAGATGSALPLWPSIALVVASIAWAAGMVRTRMHASGDPMRTAALQLITGGLLLLPLSGLTGEFAHIAPGFSAQSLLALSYLIVAGSLGGYMAYVWLLHRVSASKVSSHAYVNPLIAVIVGALLANERIYATTLLAGLLILVSVFFIVREPRSEQVHVSQTASRHDDSLSEGVSQRHYVNYETTRSAAYSGAVLRMRTSARDTDAHREAGGAARAAPNRR
jgi:drug/metabolite transporter (DMT)-like permease